LLTILSTPVGSGRKADASLILARQLIAAKLNLANGSDPTSISSAIATADALLAAYSGKLPYEVRPSSDAGQQMVSTANMLENYNKGLLTPVCSPLATADVVFVSFSTAIWEAVATARGPDLFRPLPFPLSYTWRERAARWWF